MQIPVSASPQRVLQRRRLWRRMLLGGVVFACTLACLGGGFIAGALAQRNHLVFYWKHSLGGVRNRLTHMFSASEMPTLHVDMKFKHFMKVQEKREAALQRGRLLASSDDFVPATIRHDDQVVNVEMRLKGDALDHLMGEKWSFRIKVKGGDALMGMRVFSVQHPHSRVYDHEWLYHQVMRDQGILGLRYEFVRVFFNGEDLGVFAQEEHFSKELLESQDRRESVIVKFDESTSWGPFSSHGIAKEGFDGTGVDLLRRTRPDDAPELWEDHDAAAQLLQQFVRGDLAASELFHVDRMARYLALTDLFGTFHGVGWTNIRFAYDPVSARLEPIAYDGMPRDADTGLVSLYNDWSKIALQDPTLAAAYVEELRRVSTPEFYAALRDKFVPEWRRRVSMLLVEWPGFNSAVWACIERNQANIREALQVQTIAVAQAFPAAGENELQLEVGNLAYLPVELVGVRVGEEVVRMQGEQPAPLLPPITHAVGIAYSSFPIALPADGEELRAICRLVGGDHLQEIPVNVRRFKAQRGGPRPVPPRLDEVLSQHSFLRERAPGQLEVVAGEHVVVGDLVLPQGVPLHIGPATTLRFAPGAILLASAPLHFVGSAAQPIALCPIEDAWGGVVVVDAVAESFWNHVEVRDTSALDRDGWRSMGGVCFQESPVRFLRCRFLDATSEDALNVIRSELTIDRCEFRGCASDAFDGDFVTGLVTRSRFHQIAGDAVDISGSDLVLVATQIHDVADKGVSVGEASRLEAENVEVHRAHFGFVSKDRSHVSLRHVQVHNAHHGLAAYGKKPEYGPAILEATNVTLVNVERSTTCQTGSTIRVEGETAATIEISLEEL
ncbi:MAG: right-handed parallel beta-helix repeat-containing protein [Planctomycetota bacterium]